MTFSVAGIGTAQTPHQIAQADAREIAVPLCCSDDVQSRRLRMLFDRSGVLRRGSVVLDSASGPLEQRQSTFLPPGQNGNAYGPTTAERMRLYEKHAVALACDASGVALQNAATGPSEVTHLVTVSCSGFFAPGVDVALIDRLGLPLTTQRTHIGFMGCHGALNGLRVADAFLGANTHSVVLVCAVELCSLHFQYGWKPEKIVANALFADGSAAVVARQQPGQSQLRLLASGSYLVPGSTDAMSWKIGDHGFVMTLSRELPGLIEDHLRNWMEPWLDSLGIALEAVGSWAVHPGGPRILDAVESALSLPADALEESRQVLAEHGNMSSPTLLFILERLLGRDCPRPIVALGFGPGLMVEAAVFV